MYQSVTLRREIKNRSQSLHPKGTDRVGPNFDIHSQTAP